MGPRVSHIQSGGRLCRAGVVTPLCTVLQDPRLLFGHPWGTPPALGSGWLTTMSMSLATGGREQRRRGTFPSFKTLSLGLSPGNGLRLLLGGSAVPCIAQQGVSSTPPCCGRRRGAPLQSPLRTEADSLQPGHFKEPPLLQALIWNTRHPGQGSLWILPPASFALWSLSFLRMLPLHALQASPNPSTPASKRFLHF